MIIRASPSGPYKSIKKEYNFSKTIRKMTSSSAETPLPFSREDISREEERGSEEGEGKRDVADPRINNLAQREQ